MKIVFRSRLRQCRCLAARYLGALYASHDAGGASKALCGCTGASPWPFSPAPIIRSRAQSHVTAVHVTQRPPGHRSPVPRRSIALFFASDGVRCVADTSRPTARTARVALPRLHCLPLERPRCLMPVAEVPTSLIRGRYVCHTGLCCKPSPGHWFRMSGMLVTRRDVKARSAWSTESMLRELTGTVG